LRIPSEWQSYIPGCTQTDISTGPAAADAALDAWDRLDLGATPSSNLAFTLVPITPTDGHMDQGRSVPIFDGEARWSGWMTGVGVSNQNGIWDWSKQSLFSVQGWGGCKYLKLNDTRNDESKDGPDERQIWRRPGDESSFLGR